MTYRKMIEKLHAGRILLLDGGTGTELEKRGVPMDPGAWCGIAALDNADILEKIHTDYLDAGADIITTNTYSSSRLKLALSGNAENFLEINKKTIAVGNGYRTNNEGIKQLKQIYMTYFSFSTTLLGLFRQVLPCQVPVYRIQVLERIFI